MSKKIVGEINSVMELVLNKENTDSLSMELTDLITDLLIEDRKIFSSIVNFKILQPISKKIEEIDNSPYGGGSDLNLKKRVLN